MKRLFAILFLFALTAVASAADLMVRFFVEEPGGGQPAVYLLMPFDPQLNDVIRVRGVVMKVRSREFDYDTKVMHCRVTLVKEK